MLIMAFIIVVALPGANLHKKHLEAQRDAPQEEQRPQRFRLPMDRDYWLAYIGRFLVVLGGIVSDKIGKRKPLIALVVSLVVIGLVILALTRSAAFYYVYTALVALSLGIFQAVDQALMVEVLPDRDNAAHDVGILVFIPIKRVK